MWPNGRLRVLELEVFSLLDLLNTTLFESLGMDLHEALGLRGNGHDYHPVRGSE